MKGLEALNLMRRTNMNLESILELAAHTQILKQTNKKTKWQKSPHTFNINTNVNGNNSSIKRHWQTLLRRKT
jgi:hypothetical protein